MLTLMVMGLLNLRNWRSTFVNKLGIKLPLTGTQQESFEQVLLQFGEGRLVFINPDNARQISGSNENNALLLPVFSTFKKLVSPIIWVVSHGGTTT